MVRLITPLVFILVVVGCSSSTPEPVPEPAAAATTLPSEGTRYEPSVDKGEVPAGAWMCDMGTVHFAAPHPGECPVCGMKLVEKK